MNFHNLIEDIVIETASDIFSDKDVSEKNDFCKCSQCYKDVICFVLNRMKPVYIFSSRGASHFKMNYQDNLQRRADIVSLIHKGIERVIKVKRPHFSHNNFIDNGDKHANINYFIFPTITGKILNSETFSPVCNIPVSLYYKDKLMDMVSSNWQNPYTISTVTACIFAFLPFPIKAASNDIEKVFELEIVIEHEDFKSLRHYFSVIIISDNDFVEYYRYNSFVDLKEIHLIPLKKTG